MQDNPFMDNRIKSLSEKATLVIFKFENKVINLHIESCKKSQNRYSFSSLTSHLMAINCLFGDTNHIDIFYIPSGAKKMLPNPDEIIGPMHINSGSTLAIGHGEIDIWRKEEFAKLATHELLHCICCDIKNYPDYLIGEFYKTFKIDDYGCGNSGSYTHCRTRLFPNEAYVETMANIFHTMYVKLILGQNAESLLELLEIERKWAIFQCAKVLRHNGFDSVSDFLKQDQAKHGNQWRQNSNVFSYIILRGALMYDLGLFLMFMTSGDSFACFAPKFQNPKESFSRLEKFTALLIAIVTSSAFSSNVSKAMSAKTPNGLISRTLRMTALELSTFEEWHSDANGRS